MRYCMYILLLVASLLTPSCTFDFSFGSSLIKAGSDRTEIRRIRPDIGTSARSEYGGAMIGSYKIASMDAPAYHNPVPDSHRNQFYYAIGAIVKAEMEGSLLYRRASSTSEANLLKKAVEAFKVGQYDIARKAFGKYSRLIKTSKRRKRSTGDDPTMVLREDGLTSDDINNFLGLTGGTAMSFVFDTTGSMGGAIENCKEVSKNIARKRAEVYDPLATYVLTEFNDPSVGPSNLYTGIDEFLDAITYVKASGGGDCEEKSMEGVMQAIGNTPPDSPLFIFTDAPAKDPELSEHVQLFAEMENKPLYFVTSEKLCSSVNEGLYDDLATATGGMVLEYSHEGSNLNELMTDLIQGKSVVSIGGDDNDVEDYGFKKRKRSASNKEIAVVVDDSVPKLTIVVAFEEGSTGSAKLLEPSRRFVEESAKSKSISKLTIFNIHSPSYGTYYLQVIAEPSAKYAYTAMTSSKLNLDFEYFFLEPVNIGRKTIETVINHVIPGRTYKLTMIISGNIKLPVVELVEAKNSGKMISRATDIEHYASSGDGMNGLSAKVTIPKNKFRVKLTGLTTNNIPFERVSKKAKKPRRFSIFLYYTRGDNFVKPGKAGTMIFKVFYGGTKKANPVTIEVRGSGLQITYSTKKITMSPGNYGLVTIMYKVPASAKPGHVFRVSVKITDSHKNKVITKEDVLVAA